MLIGVVGGLGFKGLVGCFSCVGLICSKFDLLLVLWFMWLDICVVVDVGLDMVFLFLSFEFDELIVWVVVVWVML